MYGITKPLNGLRKVREQQKMSQDRLARLVGTSRKHICAYELGLRRPSDNMVRWLAETLHCTEAELLGGD